VGLNLQENIGTMTKIEVYENEFKDRVYGIGINVFEPVATIKASYEKFQLYNNSFVNIPRGINVENVTGLNYHRPLRSGVDGDGISYNNYNYNFIIDNNNFSLRKDVINNSPSHYGIRVRNCHGGNYVNNALYSYNQQIVTSMYGLSMWNSPNSLADANEYVNMDIGMYQQSYMLNSNYTCNTFNQCKYGYFLAYHTLRENTMGATLDLRVRRMHGWNDQWSQPRSNGEGCRIDIFNSVNTHIHVHRSYLNQNQWSFTPGIYYNHSLIRINYYQEPSTAVGTIIAGYSVDRCGQIASILPVPNSQDYSNTDTSGFSPLDYWNFVDYVNREYARGGSSTFIYNYDIVNVHSIENLIAIEKYDSAALVLAAFTPISPIAADFKQVANAIVQTRLSDSFEITDTAVYLTHRSSMDSSFIVPLTLVAQKNIHTQTPYAATARMLLWLEFGIEIEEAEEQPLTFPSLVGQIHKSCRGDEGQWRVYVEHQAMGYTGIEVESDSAGNFWFGGYTLFTQLDTLLTNLYRIVAVSPDFTDSIFSDYANLNALSENLWVLEADCPPVVYPDITGWVNQECSESLGGWTVYLEHFGVGLTGYTATSDSSGNFVFTGNLFTFIDTASTEFYRLQAVSPDFLDILYSPFVVFDDLATMFHVLDCSGSMITSVSDVRAWMPYASIQNNTLELYAGLEPCTVSLLDISGRLLYQTTVSEKNAIDMHTYSQGIYILRFENLHTHDVQIRKIIKSE
ncbi:MAG: T9SS type A sorting domain-containing protein, partial [Bacteroidia bacterium]|nr:T9SS type A sorting domain-containing protein [Bacteroidia bacterium]